MAKEQVKKDKRFFKDFRAELKKVIWPSTKQLVNNTSAVVVIVIIIAVIVFGLDVAFESMNTYGIDRIKSLISSNESVVEDNDEENSDDVVIEDNENNEADVVTDVDEPAQTSDVIEVPVANDVDSDATVEAESSEE